MSIIVTVVVFLLGLMVLTAVLAFAVGFVVGAPMIVYSLVWAGFRARLYPIAVRNLVQHRRRTVALGGAIAAVTALLVILLGLTAGVRATMLRSATTLMSGHVNVGGFYKVTAGTSAPLVTDYDKIQQIVAKTIPNVDYISSRGRGYGKIVSETGASIQVGMGGIDIAKEPGFRDVVQMSSGNIDDLTQPNTILIFEEQAKKLDVKVGDVVTVAAMTLRGASNTADARVVGIAKNIGLMSQFNVFLEDDTLRNIYRLNENTTGALHIYLKQLDDNELPNVAERLRKALAAEGFGVMAPDPQMFWAKFEKVNRETWTGQKLDVTLWKDEIAFVQWVIRALDAVVYGLIFVLIVIIAVGIMNTLWIAIRERTREIGTLRAIGMHRRYVLATFVIEAFTLSLAATITGAAVGLIACVVLNAANIGVPLVAQLFLMSEVLTFNLQVGDSVLAIALIALCMTFIALIPSYIAARMKPITAMHHIG
jgi:putative ABC transport system permease protein